MARISTYTKDTSISSGDKLLGSDSSGDTRNFVIGDMTKFIAETGAAGENRSVREDNSRYEGQTEGD